MEFYNNYDNIHLNAIKKYFINKKPILLYFIILYGPPASGKSYLSNYFIKKMNINMENLIEINIDKIISNNENINDDKNYWDFRKKYDSASNMMIDMGIISKLHILIETTGKTITYIIKQIEKIKKFGYNIIILYPYVKKEILIDRINKRITNKTQITIKPDEIEEYKIKAEKNINYLSKFCDEIFIYDNNDINNMELILEYKNGIYNCENINNIEGNLNEFITDKCKKKMLLNIK